MSQSDTVHGGEVVEAAEVRQVTALTEISQALGGTLSFRSALVRVLEVIDRQYGVLRGAAMIISPNGQLQVSATHGITAERAGARYGLLGEGVTARVVESGRPVIVPQVSREPLFRDRVPRAEIERREESFICVPILLTRKPVGALAVDLPFKRVRD